MQAEIRLKEDIFEKLLVKSNETGVLLNDIVNDILGEEVDNYKAKIKLSDRFADLKGICDFDESADPVEIRDMIRERKL